MKSQRIVWVLAAALGLLPVGGAVAEGFYFGVSGGVANVDLPSKGQFDLILQGAQARSSVDESGDAWGLQVGYRWNRYFAAELGYFDFGQAGYKADYAGTTSRYSVRYVSTGPALSALGILPIGERFDLHGRAGVYFGDTRVREKIENLSVGDFASVQGDSKEKEIFLGVGGAWNINENFSLRLEYQRFLDVGDEDHTGERDVDLVTIGVLFR